MDFKEICALMERFEASSIQHFELEQKDFRLALDKALPAVPAVIPAPVPGAVIPAAPAPAAPAPAAPAPAPEAEGSFIKAPLVGTFYAASSPDAAPFAPVGTAVKKGQTVCILEAMKMMSEVPAPADGIIAEVLVSDGELVGFDQPLFRLK
ncbi:acetyl-CoA carboxylase biotin carboxyl carrier protein [Pseudoflavonifractor sp. DSM 107456]|uniref:Biotin carboxyl carrier protein of acetyl-CoA carboxylase n=2 Tax=Pseudoflavonifractor TaxID=1017280 RepID=A0ABR9R7K1_9FIRM|nr:MULTISPECIES: acetyl-CoA carboxylase biotin carboxyl carrier protein [Pseudoflavonifractor]MBC5729976.1 acetyl-CoA carboxylase biotin carboxyl carrier protein [Pseudoflavonifractor hominis]MBE5054660.1 acetyl-CoA carboxylase biotin carboxyl carrier protein [Pseudoflavonifractor gallinarum]MBS5134260.1 acetyl-CoA carboxylase biotin carboxyl carrier protein [Oscillospiraceae bacterium]